MSIRVRFTLALTAVGVVLFGAYALWAYRSERDDLRTAATSEIRILGRSLATALGNALRDRQGADVEETLSTLVTVEPSVDIYIHDRERRVIASRGAATDTLVEGLIARAIESRAEIVIFDPPDEPSRMIFAGPLLADDGGLLGSLVVSRPAQNLAEDLQRTRDRLLIIVLTFLVLTIASGLVLGTVTVTRPIARLLDGVRKVRAGDFRRQMRPARADEIGQLVDEFNLMIAALADQRVRTDEEADARSRLERGLQRVDKLVTIGQLSAGLAHEIGSPLQVLSGRASLLVAHADPQVRRQAEVLVEQCDRIAKIVEQLLSFGRRRTVDIAPCDLVEPVRAVIDLLAAEAKRRQVSLAIETDEGTHVIEGDRDQLQQVALNLVRNALAVTPSNGIVTVRIDRAGDAVRLVVRDSGPGMDDETRTRLFEPFFTTRASQGGTGLGLAVVQTIATEHRATIDVHSQPGHGAEFVVSFPVHTESSRG